MEMVRDIDKQTVDFQPNYDETLMQPSVLPSRFPNLLGQRFRRASPSAWPPTSRRTTWAKPLTRACIHARPSRMPLPSELMQFVQGPDFPTGGIIMGKAGIHEAYATGRGKIVTRARSEIEPMPQGKSRIVVSEIPYMVNKARLYREDRRTGARKARRGHNRHPRRVRPRTVCDISHRSAAATLTPHVVLNQLYKHTQLQVGFGVNMLALVDGAPKHALAAGRYSTTTSSIRRTSVTRRTRYDLDKAEAARAYPGGSAYRAGSHRRGHHRMIRASRTAQGSARRAD